MSDEQPQVGWSPCTGCGLCCDGTLFERARAEPFEEDRLTAAGLSVSQVGDKRYFALPCSYCSDGHCTIYADRFTKCRTFRCKLLRKFEEGGIGAVEAEEVVRTGLKLRSAVAATNAAAVHLVERQRLRQSPATDKTLRLAMAALDYFLDTYFRNKNPQVLSDSVQEPENLSRS